MSEGPNNSTGGVVAEATAFLLSHQLHGLWTNKLCSPGTAQQTVSHLECSQDRFAGRLHEQNLVFCHDNLSELAK